MSKSEIMLGAVVRRIGRWIVRFYYPKIEFDGKDQLPKTGPVLVCGNHPNSLVDPILIGITSGRPVRFMAKAPLFKTPVLGAVMSGLGMIPTYRGSDDSKQVRRNLESLDSSIQFLIDGDAVGIFPEGKTHDLVQLEMVRSGVARIAVKAVEEGAENLMVVPVGLNYAHKERFRSGVSVQVGRPIKVKDWLENSQEEGRKAIRALTNEVATRLKSVIVHLEEPNWEPLLDDFVALTKPDSQVCPMVLRKRIADAMNYFVLEDRPRAEEIAKSVRAHGSEVSECKLSLDSLVLQSQGKGLVGRAIFRFGICLFGLIPVVIGLVFHLVPFLIVRFVAARVTPPGRTAVSLYRLLVGMPVYAAWYTGFVFWLWWVGSLWPTGTLAVLVLPFLGMLAISYCPFLLKAVPNASSQLSILFQKSKHNSLRMHQRELRGILVEMEAEYVDHSSSEISVFRVLNEANSVK